MATMYLSAPVWKCVPPPGKLILSPLTTIHLWSDFWSARWVWGMLAFHTSSRLAGHRIGIFQSIRNNKETETKLKRTSIELDCTVRYLVAVRWRDEVVEAAVAGVVRR